LTFFKSAFLAALSGLQADIAVALLPVVNFINILRAAFASIYFRQKLQTQTVSSDKLSKNSFAQKKLFVKCE